MQNENALSITSFYRVYKLESNNEVVLLFMLMVLFLIVDDESQQHLKTFQNNSVFYKL